MAVFEAMFRVGKEIRIFSKELRRDVYEADFVRFATSRFFSRGGVLYVLVQEPVGTGHPLLATAFASKSGQTIVRMATGSYAAGGDAAHFAVVDSRGYRFEFDHDTFEAIANFNDPEKASELKAAFDTAFAMGGRDLLDTTADHPRPSPRAL